MDDDVKSAVESVKASINAYPRNGFNNLSLGTLQALLRYIEELEGDAKQVTECYEHLAAGAPVQLVADTIRSRHVRLVVYFKMAAQTIHDQQEELVGLRSNVKSLKQELADRVAFLHSADGKALMRVPRHWRDFTVAVGKLFIESMKPGEPFGAADMSRFESCIREVEKGLDQ